MSDSEREREAKRTEIEVTLDMLDARTAADLCGIARAFGRRNSGKTFAMGRLLLISANSPEIIARLQERYRQAATDRDDFRERMVAAQEKARNSEARALDAERRATHAVGKARRMGVGFGNAKGGE